MSVTLELTQNIDTIKIAIRNPPIGRQAVLMLYMQVCRGYKVTLPLYRGFFTIYIF